MAVTFWSSRGSPGASPRLVGDPVGVPASLPHHSVQTHSQPAGALPAGQVASVLHPCTSPGHFTGYKQVHPLAPVTTLPLPPRYGPPQASREVRSFAETRSLTETSSNPNIEWSQVTEGLRGSPAKWSLKPGCDPGSPKASAGVLMPRSGETGYQPPGALRFRSSISRGQE